ncbi:MAG: hypothetical protein EOP40_18770 [Rubrivivax sp.]|jgi:hypothetical protein|nr:MAG: hypothetical protein EOP40_18770 [Rubrivivax sp.]
MSSFASTHSSPLGLSAAAGSARHAASARFAGTRGLSGLLLAAVVAGMVVLADQLISTWADEHLFLAWVLLWVVVFAGLALFAGAARTLARRAGVYLDSWSQSMAEARAEMRMWEMARNDPRLMSELTLARSRADVEEDAFVATGRADFSEALAPLGMDVAAKVDAEEDSAWDRWVAYRSRQAILHRFI